MAPEGKKFTAATIAQFDGSPGRPSYIAYRERVIDVSGSPLWKGGRHMMRHRAGMDLTASIKEAPHGPEVLDRCPCAGRFDAEPKKKERGAAVQLPAAVQDFLNRYPLLKRHPHPALVHFPIAFMVAAALFAALHLATGADAFEATSYNCLWCGLLSGLPAALSGLFTWWVNYMARPIKLVMIKIALTGAVIALGAAALIWRIADPQLLHRPADVGGMLYVCMVLLLAPLVLAIGFCGGLLTFPVHREYLN